MTHQLKATAARATPSQPEAAEQELQELLERSKAEKTKREERLPLLLKTLGSPKGLAARGYLVKTPG